MGNIDKPITIVREEFREQLLNICNDSGLPMFCIEDILKDFIQQVHLAVIKQYEKDKEEYEQILKQKTIQTE